MNEWEDADEWIWGKLANRVWKKLTVFSDGVQVHVLKYEKPSVTAGGSSGNVPWSANEEKLKTAEPVAESGKIFVRNLWYAVTEDDLWQLFSRYGSQCVSL